MPRTVRRPYKYSSVRSSVKPRRIKRAHATRVMRRRMTQQKRRGGKFSQLFLNPTDFQVKHKLAKGGQGNVFLVEHTRNTNLYAVKVTARTKTAFKELQILKEIDHPYIVRLRYAFETSEHLYTAMDYYAGGPLDLYIHGNSVNQVRFYAAELCLAIGHLHKKGIVHRDIKPRNILMDMKGHVYLTDFDAAKSGVYSYSQEVTGYVGTFEYMAPEILKHQVNAVYGKAVDWWSFGIVLYEMIKRFVPFDKRKPSTRLKSIQTDSEYTRDIDLLLKNFEDGRNAKDFIQQLLQRTPETRLCDIEVMMQHSFFEGINWSALKKKKVPPPYNPFPDTSFTREQPITYFLRAYGKFETSPLEKQLFRGTAISVDEHSKSMQNQNSEGTLLEPFTSDCSFNGRLWKDDNTPIECNCTVYDDRLIITEPKSSSIRIKDVRLRKVVKQEGGHAHTHTLVEILDATDQFHVLKPHDETEVKEFFSKRWTLKPSKTKSWLTIQNKDIFKQKKRCWCELGKDSIICYSDETAFTPIGIIHFEENVQLRVGSSYYDSHSSHLLIQANEKDKQEWIDAIEGDWVKATLEPVLIARYLQWVDVAPMLYATQTGYKWSHEAQKYMSKLTDNPFETMITNKEQLIKIVELVDQYHNERFQELNRKLKALGTLQKGRCPEFEENYFLVIDGGYKLEKEEKQQITIEDWVKNSVNIKFDEPKNRPTPNPDQRCYHRKDRISATCPLRMTSTGKLWYSSGSTSMLSHSTGYVIGNGAEFKAGFSIQATTRNGINSFRNEELCKNNYDCSLTDMCQHQRTCKYSNENKDEAIFFTTEDAAKAADEYSLHPYPTATTQGVITAENVIGIFINADKCLDIQLKKTDRDGVDEMRRGLRTMRTSLKRLKSSEDIPCYVYDYITNRMYTFILDEHRGS